LIQLINATKKNLIEETLKFGSDLDQNCKKLKSKKQSEKEKLNWRNTKVWPWFRSKLQEIKVQETKWKERGTIRSLLYFSRGNLN
jgi:hypothetical protein